MRIEIHNKASCITREDIVKRSKIFWTEIKNAVLVPRGATF